MHTRIRQLATAIAANAMNVLFTVGLVLLTIGAAMERPSLGFIVPGALIVGLMIADLVLARRRPE